MNNEIGFYIALAAAAAIVLYSQIVKFTKKLDANEAAGVAKTPKFSAPVRAVQSPANIEAYKDFAGDVSNEVNRLKQDALFYDGVAQDTDKDAFLDELESIEARLTKLKTNANDKDEMDAELIKILDEIQNLVERYFKDAQLANERMMVNLEKKFKALAG